jgi:dihydrolipoamide dehydrogenase
MMRKIVIVGVIALVVILSIVFDVDRYLNLAYLKANIDYVQRLASDYPWTFGASFFAFYVLATGVSLPGAAVLTIAAGAIFGILYGTVLVSFASTIGATIAFLASRYVLSDPVRAKFSKPMARIDRGIAKEGKFYLFALRLVPISPFFLINLLMGLTKMPTATFFVVSQIGMLPGTIAYVNAGLQLSKVGSLSKILSFELIASFVALGALPLIANRFVQFVRRRRVYAPYRNHKPQKFDYDMVVIGGGAAGLVTAYVSAAAKAKVALIEKDKMGGDCLNTGCVPSKALIRSAHLLHDAKKCQDFGIKEMNVKFDFKDVMARVHQVIKKIEPHDSKERYQELGVDCITGSAKITSPWTVEVNGKMLTTRNITIACGAAPFVPPIAGLDQIPHLTSENIWALKTLPDRLLVLGGGPIGCELTQAFSRLGSKVTMVEMLDRIMAVEDVLVSEHITAQFRSEGIEVLTNHKAMSFEKRDGKNFLICETNGQNKEVEFDQVLVAVGRKARVKGYGLEELGIELRQNGTIDVNEFLQTKYPNIFACGDVTGPFQFTHTAAHQAWYCAVNSLFGAFKKFKVDYSVIPWCTYTDPEVATVGLSEQAAKREGIDYEVTRYDIEDLDRAIVDGVDQGFINVLTVPKKDHILGATIVGPQASNLIIEFVAAMRHGFGLKKILKSIHVYPSLGEANKYAAGNWLKQHASPRILSILDRYFTWLRK